MDLTWENLPQTWNEGLGKLGDGIKDLWGGVTAGLAGLGGRISDFLNNLGDGRAGRWYDFIGQWFVDDPAGATAGLLGVGLAGGVVVSVGGGALGAGARVLGKVKGGLRMLWRVAKSKLKMLTLGSMIRWGVGTIQRLWNFNINITDSQIRQQQKQLLEGLAPVFGEALGSLVGTACGFTLGRIGQANAPRLVRWNPDLLAKLHELQLNTFSEESELWEEAVGNLKAAGWALLRNGGQVLMLEGYLHARKLIKAASRGLNIAGIAPGLAGKIEQWGEEGSEPWSFAKAQEEAIESIQNTALRNFTEEFVEAAQEACAESTILVSYAF